MARPPDILLRIAAQRRERYGVAPGELELARCTGARRDAPALIDAGDNPFLAALARAPRPRPSSPRSSWARRGSARCAARFDPEAQARSLRRERRRGALGGGRARLLLRQLRAAAALPRGLRAAGDRQGLRGRPTRQLDGAKAAGADAVLLIASLYDADELRALAGAARAARAGAAGRDPRRADVDEARGRRVGAGRGQQPRPAHLRRRSVALDRAAPHLPAGALKVAESGLRTRADLGRLRQAGFDAFLIGESLLSTPDPAAKLRELLRTDASFASRVCGAEDAPMTPHVKICGVTRPEDADARARARRRLPRPQLLAAEPAVARRRRSARELAAAIGDRAPRGRRLRRPRRRPRWRGSRPRSASTCCSSTATRARRSRAARGARDQGVPRRAARCRATRSRATRGPGASCSTRAVAARLADGAARAPSATAAPAARGRGTARGRAAGAGGRCSSPAASGPTTSRELLAAALARGASTSAPASRRRPGARIPLCWNDSSRRSHMPRSQALPDAAAASARTAGASSPRR